MRWREPLLHPATLLSMAVLGVNDHWGKYAFPGVITGKLSDFAGLVFFPLLVELLPWPKAWSAWRVRVIAVAVTGAGFAVVKATPWGNDLWNDLFGWLYRAVGWAQGSGLKRDPTDLVALLALIAPLRLPLRPEGEEEA